MNSACTAYKERNFDDCVIECGTAIKSSSSADISAYKLLRACAFYRLAKYSRALSDCSEVLGGSDKRWSALANQLKGECFLRDDDWDGAQEAFEAAASAPQQPNKVGLEAFRNISKESSGALDFNELQVHSATAVTHELLLKEYEQRNAQSTAARVSQAMARPGPSVRAEDMAAASIPISGKDLLAPTKYRMQFNQNGGLIEVQVFAKGLNKQRERVSVSIQEQFLKVEIKNSEKKEVEYLLEEKLYQNVIVAESKWDIWATQAVPGGACIVNPNAERSNKYPTSSQKQHTDWGKLEQSVKKEDEEEQLDGDAGLQKFFRKLYADADEDTRRAMNKSFQQSGGTSLSTNWGEVRQTDFECNPPEGVKVKKFEQ